MTNNRWIRINFRPESEVVHLAELSAKCLSNTRMAWCQTLCVRHYLRHSTHCPGIIWTKAKWQKCCFGFLPKCFRFGPLSPAFNSVLQFSTPFLSKISKIPCRRNNSREQLLNDFHYPTTATAFRPAFSSLSKDHSSLFVNMYFYYKLLRTACCSLQPAFRDRIWGVALS